MNFNCFSSSTQNKKYFQVNKLNMLKMFKDSLERKIAAVSASISVLEEQINRDEQSTSSN